MARRDELGLPDVAAQFRRGKVRPGRTPRTAAVEAKIVRTHSPKVAAKLLDLPLYVIRKRRQRLGLARKNKRLKPAEQDGRRRRQK